MVTLRSKRPLIVIKFLLTYRKEHILLIVLYFSPSVKGAQGPNEHFPRYCRACGVGMEGQREMVLRQCMKRESPVQVHLEQWS